MNRKFFVVFLLFIVCIGISICILYFNRKDKTNEIIYYSKLNGEETISIDVNTDYNEEGAIEVFNNKEYNMKYNNTINTSKTGVYFVEYSSNISVIYPKLYREVIVYDKESPKINLKGASNIILYVGDKYTEPGYTVTDNYDSSLESKVNISGELDTNKVGSYKLVYTVTDSSNNKSETYRNIIVKKKAVVLKPQKLSKITKVTKTMSTEKGTAKKTKLDFNINDNTIIEMKFNNNGIFIKGYVKNGSGKYNIKLCNNKDCNTIKMKTSNKYYYSGNIDLINLDQGNYQIYIVDNDKEMVVINQLNDMERINRAKIGDKLVTLNYNNNHPTINIKKFNYEYDILLDAGHGSTDSGAVNKYIKEKTLNLTQTLYEMKRYQQHGLKVKMIRTDDTYGLMMGPKNESNIRRRAYAIGYYGVVSKYIYSNHHNSINDKKYSGWEIIMTNQSTKQDNMNAYKVSELWKNLYPTSEEHLRIYGRNYDTDALLNKTSGQIYNIKNYYAVQRIPYELFNITGVITYEGCYLSNTSDYKWYMDNWKKLSEAKIKVYVESLGKEYIPVSE